MERKGRKHRQVGDGCVSRRTRRRRMWKSHRAHSDTSIASVMSCTLTVAPIQRFRKTRTYLSMPAVTVRRFDMCCRVDGHTAMEVRVPVGIRIKLPGVTEQQFDEVNKLVKASGGTPEGLLFHSSGPIDEGWGVIDFWKSRGEFDAFFGSRVQEAVKASGTEMQGAPDVKEFPVHETWQP